MQAYEQERGSQRQLPHLFGISVSFMQDLWQRYRQTGSGKPQPLSRGNPLKVREHLAVIEQYHRQHPDASWAERLHTSPQRDRCREE
jgi:transposase